MTHICLHTKKAEEEKEKRELGETTHLLFFKRHSWSVELGLYTGLTPTDLGAKHHFSEKRQLMGINQNVNRS